MTQTLQGTIRNGKVELSHVPPGTEGARVVVTVVQESAAHTLTDAERERALHDLIEQMKHTQVTGGRGYLFREELYDRRGNR